MKTQQNKNTTKNTRPLHAPTPVQTPATTTPEAINALLPFALTPQSKEHAREHKLSTALLHKIQSAQLTLITGPSGSGKSTLLHTLQQKLQSTISPSNLPLINQSLPIVNLFGFPLNQTLSLLSSVGLAEPKLWAFPQRALSTGEQARLQIARLIAIAKPSDYILLDELCSNLDRLTTAALCTTLKKLITRTNFNIIAAAAHEDLPSFLNTNLLINASDHSILPSQFTQTPITIEQATPADYQSLAHLHYIAGPPANPCKYLRATRPHPVTKEPILAAVLVITYPTLNASWRKRAWPNRYNSANKSQNAKRINKELRTLARVITAPHSRGLGIATQLVNHYLNNPLTPATEAIAAMGTISPFFKNAGMTQYPIPHSPTDHRLLDTLHHLNQTPHNLLHLRPPSSLFPPLPQKESRGEGLPPSSLPPLLQRELKTWARAKNLNPNDPNLPTYAAFKLLTKPRAYTHTQLEYKEQTQ